MALPKPSDTPRIKPNPTDEENDSQFVGLESTQFKVFKTTVFKSLDTMIDRFTTLLTMKKTQDRLNDETALEASKPIADKKLKKSVGSTFSFSNALAFFAGALAVYLSDKIKETMNAIYEWADKTFTNFATPILNTLKVLPIIGPLFAAAHLMINTITNAKAHQFETEDDHDHDSIEDGDPFDLDGDDQILGTVLGDATDTIKNIEITVDDIIDGLTKNGLDKIFNRPDIPEPDLDMPDVPEPPEGGNDTGFAPPPPAPVPEGGNDTGLVAPAPVPEGGNDSGLGAPAPAAAAPSSVAPPAPGPTRQRRRATTNPNRGDLPPVVGGPPAASSSGASGTGGGAQPGQAGSDNAAPSTSQTAPAPPGTGANAKSLASGDNLRSGSGMASSGSDGMEVANPERGGASGTDIQQASHPDTGSGWSIPETKDVSGRPPVFSKGGAAAFSRMMKDSKGQVKASDIASSKRSPAKNAAVGGVSKSNHLGGNALDIHGSSQNWMRRHGKRYGWNINDYSGSHGGHFDFKGGGGAAPLPTGELQNTPDEISKAPPNVKYNQGTNASNVNPAPPFRYPAAPTPLAARSAR